MITVVLIDDHEVVRAGLKMVLEMDGDFTVVGEAGTAANGVRQVGYHEPDLAVVDVRLPDGSGVDVTRTLTERFPDTKVVVLTSHSDGDVLRNAIRNGADGFLLKRADATSLADALRRVVAGEHVIDPGLSDEIVKQFRDGASSVDTLAAFGETERRILDLIGKGMSNREIGNEVSLAEKTVKNYVSRILAGLGMTTRTQVAAHMARLASEKENPAEEWTS